MKKYVFAFALFSVGISTASFSQNPSFEISMDTVSIDNLGGLQSYAFGQSNGKWLIVGGRLDGLHRRQPWASFDLAGHNNALIVVDPVRKESWSSPLTSLSQSIQEQLSSTNMEFYQEGDYLYFLGGYGYSASSADHTTFNKLTAIHVPQVIDAVINNTSFTTSFRQITDPQFQVTGGRLKKINNDFYLLGGQKFLGRYNPLGPDHGPGFIQEYTNEIRIFTIKDDGTNISITHHNQYHDSINLHRRDYNAESQILPNGKEGITMFSGVFRPDKDLPFLNSVTLDTTGYAVNNQFQQHYNHYHCPVIPLYSEQKNEMHTLFFGGIAQFYDSFGVMVQDDNVPFVTTIASVSRNINGVMTEYKLPIDMPALMGAGAEFIPNHNFPHFENGVLKLDSATSKKVLLGYIFGGIESDDPNIFFINDGTQSIASATVLAVYLNLLDPVGVEPLELQQNANILIYPNPTSNEITVSFNLSKTENVSLFLTDHEGISIDQVELGELQMGPHEFTLDFEEMKVGKVYFVTLQSGDVRTTLKVISER